MGIVISRSFEFASRGKIIASSECWTMAAATFGCALSGAERACVFFTEAVRMQRDLLVSTED